MFPLFLKRTADVLDPHLSVVFRRLLRLGSFPACWRQANVTPIPKGPSSSSVANYRPISITPVLSKVLERLVAVRLGRFMKHRGVLLVGSTIREFSISSALWVLEVLCCQYLRSSYLIHHSIFWWIYVAVNWSTLCQECRRAVFLASCCSFCTPRNFFPFFRIS